VILFRIEFKPAARQYAPVNRCIQFVLLLLASAALPAGAQGTAFNYQGRLNDAGAPANAAYDFQFTVYNAVANGSPVSAAVTNSAVAVSNGLFSVTLDFDPGIFTGTNYWLDLAVRAAGTTNFTELSPRQPVLPVPYAIFATGASNLLGTLAAAQLTGTLPSAQVAGTYSGLVNFSNATNSFSGAFAGNGAALTNLNATQLTAGTVADARLTTNMARLNTNQTFAGANSFPNAGNSFSGAFAGSGALLTNLNGSQVVAGTVADARLTTNVALLNASQTYTGSNTYTGANSFSGANSFTNNANTFTGSFFGNGLVGWIPVAGTSVQAARDTGYLLTNSQLTTVTLPLTASLLVGDIVRISGAGAGGWEVLANTNQSFIGNFSSYRNSLWLLSNASGNNWLSLAASADGTRMYAAGSSGIFPSSDSGHTWGGAYTGFSGSWNAVATSGDGNTIYAVANAKAIQVTTNSAGSWLTGNLSGNWNCVACSADGKKGIAAINGGNVYTSANYTSWTSTGFGNTLWVAVAYAANGSLYAAANTNGSVYTSAIVNGVSVAPKLTALVCSSDGSKLVACASPGRIYTSMNSGTNWITNNVPTANWNCLAASADCTRLIAGVNGGQLYSSVNFGASWSAFTSSTSQAWSALASSADGSRLAAGVNTGSGGIYYSSAALQTSTVSTNGFLTGSQGSAVELQYIGNSQFMPVSATGTFWAN